MFRWFPAVVTLVLALGLAACGDGVTTMRIANLPSVQLPGGATSLAISGATSTQFSVSESGYSGSFTATSSNTAVATVAPMTVQSASDARSTQSVHTEAGNQGGATFTITTLENGTTTITVSDQNGDSSQFTVTVTGISPSPSPSPSATATATAAPLVIASPTAMTFNAAGQTQPVSLTESGYSGSFSSSSSNTAIATVSPATSTAFTVTAVGAGTVTLTFTDTHNNMTTVAVTVTTSSGSISGRARL